MSHIKTAQFRGMAPGVVHVQFRLQNEDDQKYHSADLLVWGRVNLGGSRLWASAYSWSGSGQPYVPLVAGVTERGPVWRAGEFTLAESVLLQVVENQKGEQP